MKEKGPFDGLIGYSQGSMPSNIITIYLRFKKYHDVPCPRFNVTIAGNTLGNNYFNKYSGDSNKPFKKDTKTLFVI